MFGDALRAKFADAKASGCKDTTGIDAGADGSTGSISGDLFGVCGATDFALLLLFLREGGGVSY